MINSRKDKILAYITIFNSIYQFIFIYKYNLIWKNPKNLNDGGPGHYSTGAPPVAN